MNDLSHLSPARTEPALLHSPTTLPVISLDYLIALLPLLFWSTYLNGPRTLVLALLGALCSTVWEAIAEGLLRKRITVWDGSAAIEGMLFALMLPVTAPYYLIPIGTLFGTLCFKVLWGGLGKIPIHPAIGAYALLYPFFRPILSTLAAPTESVSVLAPAPIGSVTETISDLLAKGTVPPASAVIDSLVGTVSGNMGQLSLLLLLLSAAYLCIRGHLRLSQLIGTLVAVFTLSALLPAASLASDAMVIRYALLQTISGSLCFLAVLPASYPACAPRTARVGILFGLGIGLLTALIRRLGLAADGAVYAVLLMQLLLPFLNRALRPRRYGQF